MESQVQRDDQVLSVQRLPVSYFLIVADGRLVYEGTDEKAVTDEFYRAAKEGAKSVACFINGVKIIHSRAVDGVSY